MYISLTPGYAIRNDRNCSYLIKIERVPDTAPISKGVISMPPFMGHILSLLGFCEYDKNIKYISDETGLSEKAIRNFLEQLIENSESRCIKIGEEIAIVFPKNLLCKLQSPCIPKVFQTPDFDWRQEFKMLRPSAPLSVNIMVTTKCTTDCQYCYANRGLVSLLTTDELIGIVNDLKSIGVVNLSLTGGDIFALDGWQRLIHEVRNIGYNPFLSTKTPLSSSDVKFLKELGCTELQFSIDSCNPDVLRELIHARDGYLNDVKEMFKACSEYGINVMTRTVLTSLNSDLESIIKLYEFFCLYPCIKDWSLTPAFLSEYKEENYKRLEPDNKDLEALYPFLSSPELKIRVTLNKLDDQGYRLKRCTTVKDFVANNTVCLANSTVISILANGKCSVCEMLYEHPEFIIGDIRTNSMTEIWNSTKALDLYYPKQELTNASSSCSSCTVFNECKRSFGKMICYMDIMKSHFRIDDPDPKCPMAPATDKIL